MTVYVGKRYTVLANLISQLHSEVTGDGMLQQDAKRVLLAVNRMRAKMRWIVILLSCPSIACILLLTGMITVYFDEDSFTSILFLSSTILLIMSTRFFTRKIHISNTALDVYTPNQ